jgi:hypothetical protein
MLLVRKPNYYNLIEGFDIDQNSLDIADKICDKWITEGSGVKNNLIDSSKVEYKKNDIVINCSPEHMENSEWFHKIPLGTTVCIQTSNMKDKASPWFIKTVHSSIEEVIAKYPLTNIFYQGELDINYGSWGYKRYMIIGIK